MRNTKLHSALKRLLHIVAAAVHERLTSPDRPQRLDVIVQCDVNRASEETVLNDDWFRIYLDVAKALEELPIYQESITELNADPVIGRHLNQLVGTHDSRMRVEAKDCIQALMLEVLQNRPAAAGDEGLFQRLYEEFEDAFHQESFTLRFLAPLENFEASNDFVSLGEGLAIVRIPDRERSEMMTAKGGLRAHPHLPPLFGVEWIVTVPKVIGNDEPRPTQLPSVKAREVVDEVVAALRLFKPGLVLGSEVIEGRGPWNPLRRGISTMAGLVRRVPVGPSYALSADEIERWEAFWASCVKFKDLARPGVRVAARRLSFGIERIRPEDMLVDYFIGLEALLLRGDEQQEMGYRLALRGARLLGKSPTRRAEIFDELKAGYRARSGVVHRDKLDDRIKVGKVEMGVREFVTLMEETLRAAIKEFILTHAGRTETELLAELDRTLVEG